MKKKITIPVFLLSIFIAALVTFQCTFLAVSESYEDRLAEAEAAVLPYEKLDYLRSVVDQYYLFSEGRDESDFDDFLAEMYLYYYVEDEFSTYYTAEAFEEYLYQAQGNLVGIGVSVAQSQTDDTIQILYTMEDSPAREAGLLPGDWILAVDGVPVTEVGVEAAVNMVRGEVGTEVTILVSRTALDGTVTEFTVTMTRREVISTSVLYSVTEADPTVAIIHILQFDGTTPTQFKAAVEQMKADGISKVIFDVRNNPGGAVDSVAAVLDMIIERGPIATLYDANDNVMDRWTATTAEHLDIPMVVLANEYTASAGELFTQALKDYELATVIGTQTFGKGVGQSAFALPDGSWIYLTALYYDPPKSENYHKVGITPDLTVELPEEYKNMLVLQIPQSEDTQLAAAIATLNGEND